VREPGGAVRYVGWSKVPIRASRIRFAAGATCDDGLDAD
jgi:hypothetical protein